MAVTQRSLSPAIHERDRAERRPWGLTPPTSPNVVGEPPVKTRLTWPRSRESAIFNQKGAPVGGAQTPSEGRRHGVGASAPLSNSRPKGGHR